MKRLEIAFLIALGAMSAGAISRLVISRQLLFNKVVELKLDNLRLLMTVKSALDDPNGVSEETKDDIQFRLMAALTELEQVGKRTEEKK